MPDLKSILFKYRFHFLLMLVSLIWISLFNFLIQSDLQQFISPDAVSYQVSAKNLYVFHRGDQYRPILMALIYGVPYLFGFGDSAIYNFSIFINLFCWLGSLLLLLEILSHFVKPKVAFWLTVVSIFFVGINAQIFELATECVYLLFITATCYFLARYCKTESFQFLCFALAIVVLSMLIKPGSKFLAIIATVIFIKEIIFNYGSRFAWLIYGSYALVLVQCAGLKHQFGNFTLSYIDAVTYYDYLGAKAESLETGEAFKTVWKRRADFIYSQDFPDQKTIASADFIHQLKSHSGSFFKAYLDNLIENSTTGSLRLRKYQNIKAEVYFTEIKTLVINISKYTNAILSIVGFLLSLLFLIQWKRYTSDLIFAAFFIAYIILLSGISCSEGDRFSIVTFPFVIVLIAKLIGVKRKDWSVG